MLLDHRDAQRHRVPRGIDLLLPAVDAYRARIGLVQAVEDLHDRALAGAVLAQKRHDLAAIDRKADPLVRDDLREEFRYVAHLKERNSHPLAPCRLTFEIKRRRSAPFPPRNAGNRFSGRGLFLDEGLEIGLPETTSFIAAATLSLVA